MRDPQRPKGGRDLTSGAPAPGPAVCWWGAADSSSLIRDETNWLPYHLSGSQGRLRLPPQAARTAGPPSSRPRRMGRSREAHHPAQPYHFPEGGHRPAVADLGRYATWSGTTSAGVLGHPPASRYAVVRVGRCWSQAWSAVALAAG
jgi:hypothetical protein